MRKLVTHIPLSDMQTPLGMLYVVSPDKLREVEEGGKSGEWAKKYHVHNTKGDEIGYIVKVRQFMGLLTIEMMIKNE